MAAAIPIDSFVILLPMHILRMRESHRLLFVLVAIFLLVGLFFVLFHHHADGQDHPEHCFICRLAQQIVSFFVLAVAALIGLSLSSKRHFVISLRSFISLLFSSKLQNRAPPVFA